MTDNIEIFIELCRDNAVMPAYARHGDAGMDIRSCIDITIEPMTTKLIPTGIKVAIPEGYELQVRPRSGMSLKTPIRISNAPGTIDSGFRDEICIIVTNTSATDPYTVKEGDRIAQIVPMKVPHIQFNTVSDVSAIGDNRGGGFGSTGR